MEFYLQINAIPAFGINEMHLKQNNLLVQAQEKKYKHLLCI